MRFVLVYLVTYSGLWHAVNMETTLLHVVHIAEISLWECERSLISIIDSTRGPQSSILLRWKIWVEAYDSHNVKNTEVITEFNK